MARDIFRLFKGPGDAKEDRADRRRGQLRRAQQTYQQRKNQYAKDLEEALAKSRSMEEKLFEENGELHNFLDLLQGYVPSHLNEQFENLRSRRLQPNPTSGLPTRSPLRRKGTTQSPDPTESVTSWSTEFNSPVGSPVHDLQPVISVPAGTAGMSDDVQISALDPITLGMEFVLLLEHPCMGHIHSKPDADESGHGHGLTASSQLLSVTGRQPDSQIPPLELANGVSKEILENLFRLSPQVSENDTDITPIQAWVLLQNNLGFSSLGLQMLKTLTTKLADYAKCYGFGATIPSGEFSRLMLEVCPIKY